MPFNYAQPYWKLEQFEIYLAKLSVNFRFFVTIVKLCGVFCEN